MMSPATGKRVAGPHVTISIRVQPRASHNPRPWRERERVRGLSLRAERSNLAGSIMGRVLSPHQPDVLALREAKQVALRSARVPCGATHISLPRHGKGDRPMLLRLILV